jgi:hypothetical protein
MSRHLLPKVTGISSVGECDSDVLSPIAARRGPGPIQTVPWLQCGRPGPRTIVPGWAGRWTSSRAREGDDPRGLRSPRVWTRLAAAATSVERGSGTARLMLPADPEMIAAVAAPCAAETACCPHARVLLEVTAGQVILAVEAPSTTGLLDTLFPASTRSLR